MMKKEMVLKMQRFYGIRHVMLEGGYITLEQFMTELLDYQLHLGMQPPTITVMENSYNRTEGKMGFDVNEWEEDRETKS